MEWFGRRGRNLEVGMTAVLIPRGWTTRWIASAGGGRSSASVCHSSATDTRPQPAHTTPGDIFEFTCVAVVFERVSHPEVSGPRLGPTPQFENRIWWFPGTPDHVGVISTERDTLSARPHATVRREPRRDGCEKRDLSRSIAKGEGVCRCAEDMGAAGANEPSPGVAQSGVLVGCCFEE